MHETTLPNLLPALPEILMASGAIMLLMLGVFLRKQAYENVNRLAMMLLFIVFNLVVFLCSETPMTTFGGSFEVDFFACFMKGLILIAAFVSLLMSDMFFKVERCDRFEYPVLVILATLGMMMMTSANDLIALYLGLEMQSLALYVLASIQRETSRATEAGLKYFVLGALASGMLLYGASLIYGFTGSTNFSEIAMVADGRHAALGLVFGFVFLLAGIAFKISAAPFHMWTPDVYEGAPTPVTAFFATAAKVAAISILIRVTVTAFPAMTMQWQHIMAFTGAASVLWGAFAAIGQQNIKRMMAYSSIGHMGFVLLGMAAGSENAVNSVIMYMTIYTVMTLGTFSCILAMRRSGVFVENINDLAGLSKHDPMFAFLLSIMMFSLAGLPPLAGFFIKFQVLMAIMEQKFYLLALIGILASVVSAFYYLRIVKIMYFDEPVGFFEPAPSVLQTVLFISSMVVLFVFIFPGPLMNITSAATASLF